MFMNSIGQIFNSKNLTCNGIEFNRLRSKFIQQYSNGNEFCAAGQPFNRITTIVLTHIYSLEKKKKGVNIGLRTQ